MHWGLSGSSGLIGVRPGGRWVDPESLRSLGCGLAVVGFVRCSWVHWSTRWGSSCSSLGYAIGLDGLIRGRWIVWGAPRGWSSSSGVARLIGVHPGRRPVRACSLGRAHWVVGFTRGRWVCWGAPYESLGVAGFIGVRPRGR